MGLAWWFWWRPPCLRRAVIVNLISDRDVAIRGVLWAYRGAWFTVKDAAAISKVGTTPVPMIGDQIIHRSNVAFLQVLP